jgi:hypothetical protein
VTQLPGFVNRLLDDLGQSQLAGDLAEELHTGRRSMVWAWWQAGAGIVRASGATTTPSTPILILSLAISLCLPLWTVVGGWWGVARGAPAR